jgi:hypothetical protein
MAISSALLHGVLGLRRPIHLTYLALSCIMACLAVFLFLQVEFYRATTSAALVEIERLQVLAAHGFMGCFLVFVPSYTGVRLPRALMAGYWCALVVLAVTNLWAPYGLWFSASPELVRATFLGEPYTAVVPTPMTLPQYAYALYYFSLMAVALVCAVKMFRRGSRRRGAIFAVAISVVFALAIVDLVRDAIGASWPYVAAYGIVTFGLLMSIMLARDFRIQADALTAMIVRAEEQEQRQVTILEALRALEHDLHAPTDVLETGMCAFSAASAKEETQVRRLQRAVLRLRELGNSICPAARTSG